MLPLEADPTMTRKARTQRLYQTLGIHECLAYDLGGKRWPSSPRELWLYRLEDGVYHEVPADPKLSVPERRRPAPLFQ